MTTIYLIRHSVRLSNSLIESYNSTDSKLTKTEKIILSIEGEERAKILSKEKELQNIDKIYASKCVRTLQTAKYMMNAQNLKVNIDERLDERRVGIPNDEEFPDWQERQFIDENFKTEGGESQKIVRERMLEKINEILDEDKDKRIAVFTHGNAMLFLLLKWCKFESIELNNTKHAVINISYKGKMLIDKKLNSPDVFKLTFDGKKLKNIEHIEFEDLPYSDFDIK